MASVYTNLYFNQPLVVLDTTVATPTSGSLVLYGGFTANGNAVLSHTNISGLTTLTNNTQSTDTSSGALIVTGGVAIVKNTNIGGNLVVEGSLTAGSFFTQNINTTNLTAVNLVGTNISTGHIKAVTSTVTNILNTNITSGTINATNSTISNGVFTAASTGTFNVTTVTASSLLATSNISTGALYSTNSTVTNGVFTAASSGTLNVNTITTSSLLATTDISTGALYSTNSTVTNAVFTAASSGTFNVNTITASSLLATSSISTSNLYSTNSTVTNGVTTAFSSGSINASTGVFNTVSTSLLSSTTISGGNMSLSGDLFVGGTITTVNITTTNLIDTNFSAGVAYIGQTLSAIGNSNTVGNIFTTGGNVGINNSSPDYQLDVNGTARFSNGITTGSLNVTGNSILNGSVTAGSLNVTGNSVLNGSVTAGSLNVTGNSVLHSNVTMGSNVFISGPEFKIPVGNVSARPAVPVAGHIRYNSEIQQFEGYGPGSAWGSLGGVIDIAQTTKVLASADPSTTDGNLYFYTVGNERMRVNSAGNIGVGTSAPNYKLDVIGTLGVSAGITTGTLNVTGESVLHSNVTMGSNVFISGPEFKIPVGNVSARPAVPVAGHIRYNSEIQQFEGYGPGSAWGSLGGVIDIAQTTKVLASADPSTTDGNLYFYTVGNERMRVNSAGNIGIGTTAPTYKLQIVGDLGVSTGITTAAILATNISSGQLYGTNSTITNLVVTSLSTGSINITDLTAGKAYIPDATVGNLLNTNMTTTNILATNISSGQFLGSNATISNVVFTAASTGTINITGLTSESAYVTNATITNITASTLITNTIDMTPSLGDIIKEVSFSAANNQVVEANITPLAFSNSIVRSFNIIISISVLKSSGSNLYANFELKGIQKDSGDWSLNSTFVGDNTGIVFGVTNVSNKGQIQYTSSNLPNWTSTTFKFKATTTSV